MSAYQQSFDKCKHDEHLFFLRQLALRAMELLSVFHPRLVGPVLEGLITKTSPVNLLLFADPIENINIFFIERRIPFEMGTENLMMPDGKTQPTSTYLIHDKDQFVEIIALPLQTRKKLPIHPKMEPLLYRGIGIEDLKKLIQSV